MEKTILPSHFSELAAKRYSCRKMTDQKVDDRLVEQIIGTAMKAPTAVNKQPYRIWWMKSEEAKAMIRQVTRFDFGADVFLVVGYKEDEAWIRSYDQHNFAEVDASIVATHLMMEIEDLGLSTTWVGHFNAPLLHELCPAMEGYGLIAIFPIGYAAEDGGPAQRHFERKDQSDILQTL